MTIYSYIHNDGEVVELKFPMGEAPESSVTEDGDLVTKCCVADHQGKRSGKCWPRYSDALGVHPDQIPEAVATYKANGVHVEFNADGQLKMEDRAHRKRVCEAGKWSDYDAGYSDRAPVSREDKRIAR